MPERSVSVLRFSGGGIPLGLAADAVLALASPGKDVPHIGSFLGLAPGNPSGEKRRLSVQGKTGIIEVLVDGPIWIKQVTSKDVAPLPVVLRWGKIRPVMGFLREGAQVVVLLDVDGLVVNSHSQAPVQGVWPIPQ